MRVAARKLWDTCSVSVQARMTVSEGGGLRAGLERSLREVRDLAPLGIC